VTVASAGPYANHLYLTFGILICLQCFDAVGWVVERASGL